MKLFSEETKEELCARLSIAHGLQRFIGLMGRRHLAIDEGLLIPRCNQIHTFFMRFPIGVVFLSDAWRVLRIEIQSPWSLGQAYDGATMVLEVHPDLLHERHIQLGDILKV